MPSSPAVNESVIDVSEAAATARSLTPSGLPLLVLKLGWEGLVSERSARSQAKRAASARITARGFSRARRFDSLNVNGMVRRSFHRWFLGNTKGRQCELVLVAGGPPGHRIESGDRKSVV